MRILFIWSSCTYSEIFMDLKRYENFVFYMDDSLDASPLSQYWMLVKWIMVSPGDEIELFAYGKLCRDNDVVYLMDEHRKLVATLSKKDNDTWKFLFDHTSEIFFKCFSDCKPAFGDLG